jgi:hypothetical protein
VLAKADPQVERLLNWLYNPKNDSTRLKLGFNVMTQVAQSRRAYPQSVSGSVRPDLPRE